MSAIDEIIESANKYGYACWRGDNDDVDEAWRGLRDMIAAAIADARSYGAMEAQQRMFPCCGGNDESPAKHCMDCETRVLPTGPRQAVPDGWRLAPVEPTPEMELAGKRAIFAMDASRTTWVETAGNVYREMLMAAPEAAR